MDRLTRTNEGRWKHGERILLPGDSVELEFEGVWVRGSIEGNQALGDIFVACDGQVFVTCLEGSLARAPQSSPREDFDTALDGLLDAAGEAAIMLRYVATAIGRNGQRPQRTYTKLFSAIYRMRQSRGNLPGLAAIGG